MMRKYIFAILLLVSLMCLGQQQSLSLPELMTPSPKATMMNRFGNYPTNLYTGLVDITIPIYTIQVKGFTLPIEFKYHASGLKYDDLPMEVGYGWTLVAGGTVSYNARGVKAYHNTSDKQEYFIKEVKDIAKYTLGIACSDQKKLDEVVEGYNPYEKWIQGPYRDSEYDEYTFSFPGHSGQFYLLDANDALWSSFSTPTSTTRFNGNNNTPTASDEYGNSYKFGVRDSDLDIGRNYTYYLTQIGVAGSIETINFTYETMSQLTLDVNKLVMRPIINTSYVIKQSGINGNNITVEQEGETQIIYKKFNTPILKEITYKGGKVEFVYSSTSVRSIEKIRIYENNVLTKTIILEKRDNAYLDAVHFNGNYGNKNQHVYSYQMKYNGTKPKRDNGTIDYWGYYNGGDSKVNTIYIPNFKVQNRQIQGMDRTANETFMQQGILTKITYPTKGYTSFFYEAHHDGNTLYGGLRIKEIQNFDDNGSLIEKKWYQYNSGRVIRHINTWDYCARSLLLEARLAGTTLYLDKKTEVFSYGAFPRCSYLLQGSTMVYPMVTEYTGTTGTPESTTEYRFTDFRDEYQYGTWRGQSTEILRWSNSWKCGKLYKKTIIDKNRKQVYSITNDYEEINRTDLLNLHVSPYCILYGSGASAVKTSLSIYPEFLNASGGTLYDYYNYYITSGEYKVSKSQESINGANVKTTLYKYNELGQVSEQTVIDSDGSKLITRNKYTWDYWKNENTRSTLIDDMYSRNMHTPVLEESVYKDGTLVDRITREYKNWHSNIVPQYIKQLNYYEPRIKYDNYDGYGNPTALRKDDLEQTYYLWGYQGTRLVAKMEGGSFSVLGKELVDRVTSAEYPSTADRQAIENLRNNTTLPNARLTTLYYHTNGWLSYVIAPNGTKTSYEYDSFGRLLHIKDHNGMILETYQYDYKQ